MRLFYLVLLCSVLNMPIYAAEDNDKKQEYSIQSNLGNIKNNLGKVLLCGLTTVYNHPFMTVWSTYVTILVINNYRTPPGLLEWIIISILLGDFAHNVLHAYNVKHYPCEKEINNSTNPEETSDTEILSDSTE